MVDLDQLECECKDCYAFEKDKVYCVKLKIPSDYPKEFIQTHCEAILEVFKRKNIQIIVIPCIEGEIDFEFFKCNSEFNFNSKENGGE